MSDEQHLPVSTARYLAGILHDVAGQYHPLVWLVVEDAETASFVAERVAAQNDGAIVHTGQVLASVLAPLTTGQRRQRISTLLEDAAQPDRDRLLVLDRIEVLFHPSLSISVGRQMESLSRLCKALVVVWPGTLVGRDLHYGKPGHPEEQKHPPGRCPVVRLDGDLQVIASPS